LKEFLKPQEILLVADADHRATGGQASPLIFHEALGITGIVLTKLDGDARGGAALSMREVTQRPIKFAGIGEKLDQFEVFVPDRLRGAGFLGWATSSVWSRKPPRQSTKRSRADGAEAAGPPPSISFNDFLAQFKMMRKLGPLESILGMLPGMGNVKDMNVDEKMLKRTVKLSSFP
jgi:signal recognition particle subunit SRP54